MTNKNSESKFEEWWYRNTSRQEAMAYEKKFPREVWNHQQKTIDELEKLNQQLAEDVVGAVCSDINESLLKALREAVNKIEFYGEQDNWYYSEFQGERDTDLEGGGKQAREYLNSEAYLNIKHLLTMEER